MPPAPREYLRRTPHRGGAVWISTNSTSPTGPFSISSLTLQTVRAGSFMRGRIFHRLTDIAISFSDFVVFIHSQFSSLGAAESRNPPAVVCLCICEIVLRVA
jgi:hypothetical protein